MALTQPILYSQVAFDATQEHIFTFNVVGGDQVVANTLTIINNTTSEQVYSEREETFTLTHILPSNSLQNGVYYAATLTTENASGEISVASNTIQFYCYTTPIFNFTNLTTGANLTTSSYNFEISYNQIESEALEQYSFNLYDYSSNLIATSGILYTNSTTVPFITQYTFMGFSNNTSYYVECTGITVGGTQITTGLISFGVNYNASSTKLNLINNCIGGYVYVASTPIAIFGVSNPDPPTYIIDGEDSYVSLKNNGEYVEWDNGFTTSTTDWTLSIWGKNFTEGENVATLSNTNGENVNIEYILNNDEAYYSLTATNNSSNNYYYKIYSNKIIPPNENDEIMIWVRRVNNIYDLFIFNNTSKYITKEGEIVTFYDAIGDREIYNITASITPVQDLNGYDNPWPAGGGKNKLPTITSTTTLNGVTWTPNADGTIKVNGTATANSVIDLGRNVLTLPAGTYTTNQGVANQYDVNVFRLVNGSGVIHAQGGGTFTLTEESSIFVRFAVLTGVTVNNVIIQPMLESGSARTSFAPYSNICPITGWTGATVKRCGKNLCGEAFTHGIYVTSTGIYYSHEGASSKYVSVGVIPVKGGQTYTISWKNDPNNAASAAVACFYNGSEFVSGVQLNSRTQISVPENADGVGISLFAATAITSISQISITNPQLEVGSTASSYETYTADTYSITFPASAGTVYGGTLDVTQGKLTVTHICVELTASMDWGYFTSGGKTIHRIAVPDIKQSGHGLDFETSHFKKKATIGIATNLGEVANESWNYQNLEFILDANTTPAQWKQYLTDQKNAGTPVQLWRYIATPIVIDNLDPVTVETLLGTNNIWADTGTVEVTYLQ